jgi:hypothetical protein
VVRCAIEYGGGDGGGEDGGGMDRGGAAALPLLAVSLEAFG